jgi:hypothetical protein
LARGCEGGSLAAARAAAELGAHRRGSAYVAPSRRLAETSPDRSQRDSRRWHA